MKKQGFCLLGGLVLTASLWAANIGMVSVSSGYNAWVLGQLLLSSTESSTNVNVEGGGIPVGVEVLFGGMKKTRFGVEIAYQPLFTASGTDPVTG